MDIVSIIMEASATDLNARIAERVRELRAQRGLSLDALARKSGVSRSMISLIERGESSPTAVVLEKLAAGLGVMLASLFDAPAAAPQTPSGPVARRDDPPIDGLADVLIDCVEGGASVSFMHPLRRDRAVAFWRRVAQDVAAGERALLVAEDTRGVCGTVQLVLDQPENQPHRAELSKMLVHRRARRQGLGAALMRAAEATARECGKTLLVLDTASADAERLYERMGWERVGVIPGYALLPQGGLCGTTLFYRNLGPAR